MNKLTTEQIDRELKRLATEKGVTGIRLTPNQREDVLEAFDISMREQYNKNLTELQQLKLLNSIVNQIGVEKQTVETAIAAQSSMRHTEYYDNFLEEGATGQILKALRDNGIPYDVLKSVSNGVEMQKEKSGKGVKITQEIEKNSTGTPIVVYFAIYKDGVLIYEFVRDRLDLSDEIEKAGGKYKYYSENVEQPKNTKSAYAGHTKLSNGTIAKHWVTKEGKEFYTVGRRRVKL